MQRVAGLIQLPSSSLDEEVLARLEVADRVVYSAGISTAGVFEIAAVADSLTRRVIATTIDVDGLAFTKAKARRFAEVSPDPADLEDRITFLDEDLTRDLTPAAGSVDVVYSRLALHYLNPGDRTAAIARLANITRAGGSVVIAVRSAKGLERRDGLVRFDPHTGRAEFRRPNGSIFVQVRHFPTADDLKSDMESAGLSLVGEVGERVETTYADYQRSEGRGLDDILVAVARKPC